MGAKLMGVLQAVLDNPILVKHARSRLRPGQAFPWALIVLVLTACIVWAGEYYPWFGSTRAVLFVIGLQILILCFAGGNQINNSLGGVRETGLIDFHRVSPLPPATVALGFFLGAPIREYLLVAITLPFALFSAYQVDLMDRTKGLLWFAQLEVAVLSTIGIIHALTMLSCMTRKKPRGSVGGAIATVITLVFISYLGSFGFYFGSRWLLDESRTLNFFGTMIPWLAWVLIYELPTFGFAALAVVRKMGAERAHCFTKAQALACMATFTTLLVGGLWKVARLLPEDGSVDPTATDVIMLASVYVLSIAAMGLVATITPDAGEYVKGMRRAVRQGGRKLSAWSDAGSNRLALFALCALVLAGATTIVHVVGRQPLSQSFNGFWINDPARASQAALSDEAWLASRKALLSRPIVVGVLTVAYVGLGLQFFSLRTRSSGLVLMSLFLFLVWLVPLLVGSGLGMSGTSESRGLTVFALSPLPGIALASSIGRLAEFDTVRFAALAPSITFAFLFNYLLVMTQRKLDRRIRTEEKPAVGAAKSLKPTPDGF